MGQFQPINRLPVLIIEDEPVLRVDAIDMVADAGFEPVEATSVEDALRILEERLDIRIVYMDLDMPRAIKGIDIAAKIRDRWPPIEIVLTAASFERAELHLPARAEFYSKPVNRRQIVAVMRRMTEQSHA